MCTRHAPFVIRHPKRDNNVEQSSRGNLEYVMLMGCSRGCSGSGGELGGWWREGGPHLRGSEAGGGQRLLHDAEDDHLGLCLGRRQRHLRRPLLHGWKAQRKAEHQPLSRDSDTHLKVQGATLRFKNLREGTDQFNLHRGSCSVPPQPCSPHICSRTDTIQCSSGHMGSSHRGCCSICKMPSITH